MPQNLKDSYILQDATVWINSIGKIGMCPSIQTPALNVQTDAYRGAGMDGEVEIPHGIEKIEWEFDMFVYDQQVWTLFGYGPGSINIPVTFRGYLQTPEGVEAGVLIQTTSLIKSIKPGKFDPGKKTDMNVMMNCSKYKQTIAGEVVIDIDLFGKKALINGLDQDQTARNSYLGFTY